MSKRILVVDDMPAMRSMICEMLNKMGYSQIDQAEDAETAWTLIHEAEGRYYDLIILDWRLSGMSGIDLLRSLRNTPEHRELSVIVMTAQSDQAKMSEAIDAGVNSYLIKPFEPEQLRQKIDSIF